MEPCIRTGDPLLSKTELKCVLLSGERGSKKRGLEAELSPCLKKLRRIRSLGSETEARNESLPMSVKECREVSWQDHAWGLICSCLRKFGSAKG